MERVRGTAEAQIRSGGHEDAPWLLALFDEAIEWLVARGQAGQWGAEPRLLLLTARAYAGRGIGARLVEQAVLEARQRGCAQLRVDCWAEAWRGLAATLVR